MKAGMVNDRESNQWIPLFDSLRSSPVTYRSESEESMSAKVERIIEEIETLSEDEWSQLVGYLERREELGWLKLSEESFAEDWNSEEDSIYDRL
jgi:hypothetical protein